MASPESKERKSKCRTINPCVLIRKLVELMEHPISRSSTERQLRMLNDFLNASHYAFWLHDIPYMIRLYELIIKKLDKTPDFQEPLECLLHFSATPPMLTKVSDQIEFKRDFQEYFSVLGYMVLCLRNENSSKLVLNAIINLLKKQTVVGYCCVRQECINEAAENSKLPEISAQLLLVVSDTLYPLLLEAVLLICKISKSACRKLANENAIEYLLRRLEPTWRQRTSSAKPTNPTTKDNIIHFEITCHILWKLLKAIEDEQEHIETPTMFALWSLQYALRWSFICPGHRVARNNLTAIILKILDAFPDVSFVESELADDITLLAVSATGHVSNAKIQFTQDDTDFQFKKIIWACLYCFKNYNTGNIVVEHNLINALTSFLFSKKAEIVSHVHYCSLAKMVIRVLPEIAALSVDNFLHITGPLQMTKMLRNYLDTKYDVSALEAYIYSVHKLLKEQIDGITTAFGEASLLTTMTSVCNKILDTTTLTNIHQKCVGRGFCILEIISVAGYTSYNVIVDLCIKYLNRVIHPNANDPVFDVKVTICALHLLWDCILADDSTHPEFVKKGGVYVVLDIAEMGTFPVKTVALGILTDLCKRSLCIPYLITWRKRGRKLVPMLMGIFRGEAHRCNDTEKGQFLSEKTDDIRTVLCRGQRTTFQNHCVTEAEILQNCRYRIQYILYALKVKYKDKVELANKYYKLYTEKLNTDDELTMLFAKNFSSLNMCQIWIAMGKELEKEGVVPVESDNEVFTDKNVRIHQWKLYLQHNIDKIIKDEMQQDKIVEYETYGTLNEARLSDALDALTELRLISNCTERMFQISRKLRISQETEPLIRKNTNYHRTLINLPFMNVFNQTVNFESNDIQKVNDDFDIVPVSPNSDKSKNSDDKLSERILEC